MAGSRTLKLSILADIDNLVKGLNQGNKETENFATKAYDLGKKIASAFVVKEIIDFGQEVAKAAMQEEESIARLNQTLVTFNGATQDQLKSNAKFIEALSNSTAIADDNLRPAMARLARSLGDVESAQKATDLAARISVNTGKDVETVANAMAKAADGQTTSLTRLGIGFSAAELKGKSFAEITDMLNEKFPTLGANAETTSFKFKQFQNLIDNTKESIGAALLPILAQFFTFVQANLIPALERVAAVFKPIINAIKENKQAFEDLGQVVKVVVGVVIYLVENMVSKIADQVAMIINIFGKIESAIRPALQAIANAINWVIEQYNKIPFLGDIGKISLPGMGGGSSASSSASSGAGLIEALGGAGSMAAAGLASATASAGGAGGGANNTAAQKALAQLESDVATLNTLQEILTSPTFTDAATNIRENARGAYYNITVNGAIDAEGTANQIVTILQDSIDRGGVAAGFIPRNQL